MKINLDETRLLVGIREWCVSQVIEGMKCGAIENSKDICKEADNIEEYIIAGLDIEG